MSRLAVSATLADRDVLPGRSTMLTVEVRNLGSVVNRYRCRLHGLDPDWWMVDPAAIELFPQQFAGRRHSGEPPSVGRFTVVIHPPRSPAAVARPWRIGALVWSEHDPTERQAEEAELTFLPFGELAGELRPSQLSGEREARATLTIWNRGNRPEHLGIVARDPGDWFTFACTPSRVTVEPGQEAVVDLHVRLQERSASNGQPARAFAVDVRPEDPTTSTLTLAGTFEVVRPGAAPGVAVAGPGGLPAGVATGPDPAAGARGRATDTATSRLPATSARRGRRLFGCLVRLAILAAIVAGLILAALALDPDLERRVSDWLREAFPQLTPTGAGSASALLPGVIGLDEVLHRFGRPVVPAEVTHERA